MKKIFWLLVLFVLFWVLVALNIALGQRSDFQHDQTRRFLFDAEMVDYVNADSCELLKEKYGSSNCYVYK